MQVADLLIWSSFEAQCLIQGHISVELSWESNHYHEKTDKQR